MHKRPFLCWFKHIWEPYGRLIGVTDSYHRRRCTRCGRVQEQSLHTLGWPVGRWHKVVAFAAYDQDGQSYIRYGKGCEPFGTVDRSRNR